MISLQHQLRRQWMITLIVIMLPMLWLADFGVRQLTTHTVLSRLQHDGDSLIAAMSQNASGQWQLDESRLGSLYQRVYSGHYFRIRDGQETDLRSRSLWDKQAPTIELATGADKTWQQQGIHGDQLDEQWLSWAKGIRVQKHDFVLWVAEDIAPLNSQLNYYRLTAVALLILALSMLMLIQRRQLNLAFARLAPLQKQLRELRFGECDDLNATSGAYPQEVQPLAEEIDRLLKLLQQRVSRSRNALGNLAHEMKRPLQQLKMLAEKLDPVHQTEQSDALLRLSRLVERELKRARIVGMSSPGRQLRLADDLPPLLQILTKMYPAAHVHADYKKEAVLPQDHDDLLELLGNLLDNACKYAGGDIALTIHTYQTQDKQWGWLIRVCDLGPGIPQPLREHLLQRGARLDEHNIKGNGLGLAIVSDIVESYAGELTLSANVPQGLCIQVRLPQ
ncbi:sensor histidine kinase [Paraglaciecola sp. MB-3u-78]|nr:sensor histidine kinase [Paraglaciecola sp. MB-3u-78]